MLPISLFEVPSRPFLTVPVEPVSTTESHAPYRFLQCDGDRFRNNHQAYLSCSIYF
jgi:hypothetical protein